MDKKYYYIVYEEGFHHIKTFNLLIDIHPLEWQIKNKNNGIFERDSRLITWQEIDYETYTKYLDGINKS